MNTNLFQPVMSRQILRVYLIKQPEHSCIYVLLIVAKGRIARKNID